jgi:O-antigen ligase
MTTAQLPTTGQAWPWQGKSQAIASLALFLFGLCAVSMPSGMLPFGALLLGTSVATARSLWRIAPPQRRALRWTLWLSVAVVVLALFSSWRWDLGLHVVEKRTRFLALPWAALWACALAPDPRWLWRGAVAGIWAALGVALVQVLALGMPRADGWNNAIVFADVTVGLAVLAALLVADAPRIRLATLIAALATIVLSGSRGALPAMALLLVVMVCTAPWRTLAVRLGLLVGAVALATALLVGVPDLARQARITELRQDMSRLERGDDNSSTGARLERLQVAGRTVLDHPLTGVGIGQFDSAMQRYVPECRLPQVARCHLGHAHNDLAEWGATQGLPGAALLVLVYAVPLVWFLRAWRRGPWRGFRGTAPAGLMLVAVFALCGLTQSMFAHQLAASFYSVAVGVLAGLSLQAMQRAALTRAPGRTPAGRAGAATA